MLRIVLFVEDEAHEIFIKALTQRITNEMNVHATLQIRCSRGGIGKVLTTLGRYIKDIKQGAEPHPDLLIVCTDSNCKGFQERKKNIERELSEYAGAYLCAVPDPHIERWLLVDSVAFKTAVGKGCPPPPLKCERDLFKKLFIDAIVDAGVQPQLGGLEYAEDIALQLDFERAKTDASLGRFISDLQNRFKYLQNQ